SLPDEDVLNIAGIKQKDYFFIVNENEIKNRLESYPLIKRAEVEKVFPNSLHINLFERKPLAMTLVSSNEGPIPVVFDDEGIIFQIGSSITNWDIPVISGIRFADVRLGIQLPKELRSLLKDLKNIKDTSPALFNAVSELKLVKGSGADFEVLMYPARCSIPVRIGSELTEHLLKYIMMVLDVMAKEEFMQKIEEIDFRTGEIVYKVKEE
ncbi:MAG: FtsQ-type POTRA domain-containing protein, partial [Spirochaetota bacterium]